MQSSNRATDISKVKIGVIGLGNMGSRFAGNLLREGFPVAVYDVKRENLDRLSSQKLGSITIADSNAELTRFADIIFAILPTAGSAVAAMLDKKGNGVISGLSPGKTIVEMSSIDSKTMEGISSGLLDTCECNVVDATISGVEENVERREIVVMAAGSKKVIDEQVRPILERVTKQVVYVNDKIGSAKNLKTATAMINAIKTMGISEVLSWLVKRDVDTRAFLEVMENSPTSLYGMGETTRKLLQDNFKPRPSWISKDIGFGLLEAEESGIPMPITAAVQQLYLLAKANGLSGYEATGIARKTYEMLANVKFGSND